ncbi:unnamed protein product [Clonostachys rosea f. rosea IK726]|uniref:Uncharacterized protein n=1 Tax=Clonostachys rosea f. rosea IK726 TaxID=1349383 RepID=A0ACA9U861_BIOOC|nr:unnamed protein product [Clonostachys rosea f. rosea IK726]
MAQLKAGDKTNSVKADFADLKIIIATLEGLESTSIEEAIREIREAIKPVVARTFASSLPTNNRVTTATTHVTTESVLGSKLPSNANADGLQISETDIPSIDHDNGETSIGKNGQTIAVGINELVEVSTAQVGDTRETIIAQTGDTVRAEHITQVGDTAITEDPTKAGATQPEDASQAGNTTQARDTAQVRDETGAATIRIGDPQQPEDTSQVGDAAEAGDATKADSLQAGDIAQAAATWAGDTATLSAEADLVPLTEAGVISEAGDTTETDMDTDAMETESTGAT